MSEGAQDANGFVEAWDKASGQTVRVWVYYNPTASEAIVYDNEPPPHFGRRLYDIGPIELDADLLDRYASAKIRWHETHAQFAKAVRAAQDRELIDW